MDEDERAELARSLSPRGVQVVMELLADLGDIEGCRRVAGVQLTAVQTEAVGALVPEVAVRSHIEKVWIPGAHHVVEETLKSFAM
ncbi:hypothetical protein [Streptomyces sp. SCL15-4]|uniref:hypothetical protein n=1 Tax=Streptomyces sp. SCL15-4 TaxID=2967221 RepID=UPI0029669C47|nr:hypothetical protein [Streptomyces sp. SCL15-4]